MQHLDARDGTRLAYHRSGSGPVLVCLPGGPMRTSAYLGDLGGLDVHRTLVRLDLRGTGGSAVPADPRSYRADRQVEDVEALREHLGLDRLDVLAHSAGTAIALLHAVRHRAHVGRLVLVTPSARVVGMEPTADDVLRVAHGRRHEPWFEQALPALRRVLDGTATPDERDATEPFWHGRWDDTVRADVARQPDQMHPDAAQHYLPQESVDAQAIRAALADLAVPVLVHTGEHDPVLPAHRAHGFAALFPDARVVVQPGAGHSPWQDDPATFARAVTDFLA